MRSPKPLLALAGALCLLACAAAPALADEFELRPIGEGVPTKGGSGTLGHQQFHLGPFQIYCATARSNGTASWNGVETLARFKGCYGTTEFAGETLYVPATIRQPVAISYLAMETGKPSTVLAAPFEITFKELKCTITVSPAAPGSGTVGATEVFQVEVPTDKFKFFRSGFQLELELAGQAGGLQASFGGACGNVPATDEGSYSGTMWESALNSNLLYREGQPAEEIGWHKVENKEGGGPPEV
jgi:hypothetical protein